MYYYTLWRKDSYGKIHRSVTARYKEMPRFRKSVFVEGAGYWFMPTTKNVFDGYMKRLKEQLDLLSGWSKDFRGIRYKEESIWTYEDGWDIAIEYYYNRHQRKHRLSNC